MRGFKKPERIVNLLWLIRNHFCWASNLLEPSLFLKKIQGKVCCKFTIIDSSITIMFKY